MTNQLTKDGLTGNSGLFPYTSQTETGSKCFFHVSANYAATKGKVFVETRDMGWERVDKAVAIKRGLPIISCSYCRRPATSVDHHYPYHTEANHCEWHRDWIKLAEEIVR